MKIRVKRTTEVEIDEEQAKQIAIAYLQSKLDCRMEFTYKDENGDLYWYYDDPDNRHGNPTEIKYKKATLTELGYYEAIQLLKRNKGG